MLVRATMLTGLALALVASPASAASKPEVRTGVASSITPTTATLNGRVDPNRAETTYFFQYGTTSLYGANTAPTSAGAGRNPVPVSVPIAGLAPDTKYHYRIVAQNSQGLTKGADRTFKTKIQPLGVTLTATPNPIAPGAATTLVGQLTGTNNAGRDVVLQSNPWPYTQGFVPTGNPLVTDANGGFSFPQASVPVTTQYRVLLKQRPEVVSPIVIVGAALQVRTDTKKVARHRHSVSVRFSGSITPQNDGGRVVIQKFVNGVWTEKAHTRAQDAGSSRSTYRTRVRLWRSGTYRVVAESDGQYVSGAGRPIAIKVHR